MAVCLHDCSDEVCTGIRHYQPKGPWYLIIVVIIITPIILVDIIIIVIIIIVISIIIIIIIIIIIKELGLKDHCYDGFWGLSP